MSFAFKLRRSLTNSSITSIPVEALQSYTIQMIKERIRSEYECNNDLYEARDVELYTKSVYIRRYMERQNGDVEKTIEMILNMMKLRKESQLSNVTDLSVPIEFYKIGAIFIYNEDKEGNPVLYIRVKFYRKIPEVKLPMENFIRYMIIKADALAAEKGEQYGWTLVFDLTGVKMSQYDLPELVFVIDFFCKYMPAGLKHIYVHNLPWFFKPFLNIALAFVPAEWKGVIKFTSKDDLFKYIEQSNMPKFLDGTCQQSYRAFPDGCRSVIEIAKEQFDLYNVTDDKVVKILKIYEKMFEED